MEISVLKKMLLYGAAKLTEKKEKLNEINVFPIPDGDTGTNMEKTILGGVKVVTEIGDRKLVEEDFDELYNGILMSSQGNSGVILSQWFKGFLSSMKYVDEVSAITLNEAFLYATESAYEAVVAPVEGTFLTVAREAQEMAEEELDEEMQAEEYLKIFLQCAKQSLKETPEKLPVLKAAGVVDSGAMGFVYLISGMIGALDESYSFDMQEYKDMIYRASENRDTNESYDDIALDEFGYCTELIVQLKEDCDFKITSATDYLNEIGNSVVAVRDKNKVKIHVHTLTPEKVMAFFHEYGEFAKIKIENMSLQHNEMIEHARREKAVVAVVNGDGIADVLKEMGVDEIVYRDAKKELSVGEIAAVLKRVNAKNTVLLLDDKNLHLVAVGVREACKDINLFTADAKTAAQQYAALSTADLTADCKEIVEKMNGAISDCITLTVKKADDISDYNNLDIKAGDYMAEVYGEYTLNNSDFSEVLAEALKKIEKSDEAEAVMAFCSNDEALENVNKCKPLILKYLKNAEVFAVKGNQEENYVQFAIQ